MAATNDRDTYFYVHTLAVGTDGKLRLLEPDRIDLPGGQNDDSSATETMSELVRENLTPDLRDTPDVDIGGLHGHSGVE